MAAAAAAAEFRAADGDHLDAGLAQQRVGVDVAVVADDHAGLERDDVVAVVPLLALGSKALPPVSMTRSFVSPSASLTTSSRGLLSGADLEVAAIAVGAQL